MNFVRRITLAAALVMTTLPASAQTKSLMQRDTLLPAVLTWLQQQGSKLTLIGEEGGLKGYLVESPTGKMQSVYVTPDGKHIVAGILLEQGGKNVTGVQIGEMRRRFDDAAKSLGSDSAGASIISQGTGEGEQSEETSPAVEETSSATEETEVDVSSTSRGDPQVNTSGSIEDTVPITPEETPSAPQVEGIMHDSSISTEDSPNSSLEIIPATSTVDGAEGNPSEVWASQIDRDTFIKAADATPYFEVGSRLAPVTLWMVADPQCPYCHAAWDHIRPDIFEKKIKVRVVLINALNGSEPINREILSSQSASRRWIESNGGRNIQITIDENSPEWKAAGDYLNMNMDFARQFGVDRTPFLGYVAPDGRFYSALGLPSDLDNFLSASLIDTK